jgi:repressor LexA
MAYLCNNEETRQRILDFIDEYVRENLISPSIRDIAEGTGISRAMVQRYMAAMRKDGEIDYGRRNVTTDFTRRLSKDRVVVGKSGNVSCGVPREPFLESEEFFSIPKSWVGEGVFYIVEASGDSMIDIGIDDGDLVLIRQATEAFDGQVVAVLTDEGTTLKRLMRSENGRPWLLAENKSYPKERRELKPDWMEIQGVALKVIKDIK